MNILVIADPFIPIPPLRYGGTERIVHLLCSGLQERGHTVHLLAAAGSRSYGGPLTIHRPHKPGILGKLYSDVEFQFTCAKALKDADVVINHGHHKSLDWVVRSDKPFVWQFHVQIRQAQIDFVVRRRRGRSDFRLLGVSEFQVTGLQPEEFFGFIHNSVDTRFYTPTVESARRYLVYLGRLTPDKGVDRAIKVAQTCGIPLKIAGNLPENKIAQQYFEQSIKGHLGGLCEWVGPVNDEEKNELLGGAMALLFPVQGEEAFGIVMIESLACGTPVIATRRASTPEVVQHGKTGFLCNTVDEMISAVKQLDTIDRRDCRLDAENRFSVPVMIDKHLAIIDQVRAGRRREGVETGAPGARGHVP